MRRAIRLTGRQQLPKSCIELRATELGNKKLLTLVVTDKDRFKSFPKHSKVKIKLNENKVSEVIDFGTLGALNASAELKNKNFVAPSCQLRIVSADQETLGLLLASTNTWTLRSDDNDDGNHNKDGILLFLPKDIAPRVWLLDIRDDDLPIVYLDKNIPNSRTWVRHDPIFISAVLPAIIQQVFTEILSLNEDTEWVEKWIRWANLLMPGNSPPFNQDEEDRREWINNLIDSFCQNHQLLDLLVNHLSEGKAA